MARRLLSAPGLFMTIAAIFLPACDKNGDGPDDPGKGRPKNLEEYNQVTEGLKDYYTDDGYFDIGVAISPESVDNPADTALIKRHFSSLTADNAMKWSTLQPVEGTFRFQYADKIVAFAEANGMKVRGHVLCWHQQIPDWIFRENGTLASREKVLERLRTHIITVMTHFKGRISAWDVVNEAIDDGGNFYRASNWYNICGEEYIFEAFRVARATDPDALLFYNDYTAIDPVKRDKIYALLQLLQVENLVDGVGMQGHWNIDYPSNALIIDAINKYKSLGIEIHITEMDVSVYTSNSDPESPYTTDLQSRQRTAYSRFFSAFRMYKENVTSVTFWGLTDGHSWLNNWPVAGRKNYPLLFDDDYNPKEAYFAIIDF